MRMRMRGGAQRGDEGVRGRGEGGRGGGPGRGREGDRGRGLGRGEGDRGRGLGREGDRGRGLGRGRGEGDRGRGLGRGRGEGDRGRGLGRGRGREGLEELIEPEQRRRGPNLTQEIRATLIDHVINHGLTLMEAGQRVQPNLSRNTVASVIQTFLYLYST